MNTTTPFMSRTMKNVFVILTLGAVLSQNAPGEVTTGYYGDVSLKTFFTQPRDFLKQSWNDSLGVWDTNWVSDSINLTFNDWFPTGYLGVTFTSGDFNACMELGVGRNAYDAYLTGSETKRTLYKSAGLFFEARKWYVEWNANKNIRLLAGNDFTPANFTASNRLLNPMIGYGNIGCLYTGFRPMIQASFFAAEQKLSAKLAIISVDTVSTPLVRYGLHGRYTSEAVLPKCEASAAYTSSFSGLFGLRVLGVGGYQSYQAFSFSDINQQASRDSSLISIQSYLMGGEVALKAWKFTTTFSGFSGRNLGPYGVKIGTPHTMWRHSFYKYAAYYYPKHDSLAADSAGGPRLYNSHVTEWALIANCSITDFLSVEAGFEDIIGNHEHTVMKDDWPNEDNYSWYGQCVVTLFDLVDVSGEAGVTNYGKPNGYGQYRYFGLGLGITF
ncbi:MAG: hypothetical protein JW768_04305 [Chitinispirillaceae bacterium]|nr:hypothetical protein [Chitinispirillaceae bacterium]